MLDLELHTDAGHLNLATQFIIGVGFWHEKLFSFLGALADLLGIVLMAICRAPVPSWFRRTPYVEPEPYSRTWVLIQAVSIAVFGALCLVYLAHTHGGAFAN